MLKNAADQQGSAFVKGPKKVDDVSFLSPKHLKEMLGPHNSHLVRRPGIGLSETAGSVQAGADVLQNRAALDFVAVAQALEKKDVADALQALNTLDPSVEHTEEAVAAALATLHSELCGNAAVEEALVKVTVAASRLYLLGMNLLPLLVCMKHPGWWTEKLPDGASDHKKVRAWRADPKDKQKMFRALAAMVQEKIAADAEYGKNDAAALFGKVSVAAGSDASSESDSKPKKGKKKSDKKSKKKKNKSSGSSQAKHKKKNKKSASGSSEESGQAKAKKGQRAKTHKKKDKKRSSSDSRQSNKSRSAPHTVVKVRRVSGMTPDNRVLVKADDRFDEVPVQSSEWTVTDLIAALFKASGQEEDAQNWTAKALVDGKCVPLSMDSTPATLHPDIVLVRKGR